LLTNVDPLEIVGRIQQPYGKGSIRREKRYEVTFEDGYTPLPGEEPFISFKNDKGEFRVVFFDEKYAELRSDTASEIHDDEQRRGYDRLCDEDSEEYEGCVRHWIKVDPYIVAYCYERYCFPMRSIDICRATNDSSWIKTVKEIDYDLRIGIDLPPWPSESWWSRFCCCVD
jgi:hypothetical protein